MSRPFRSFQPRAPQHRRNGKIRAREVRVLDETKQQLGVMPLSDALRLAQTKGLDLIEIAPEAVPPVCRIVDYGKFQYEESKRGGKESQSAGSKMKEIQLSPNIDPNDFATKLNHAIEFLCDDVRVRIKLRFRGRQKAHKEFGFEVVNRFVKAVAAYGQTDSQPKLAGDRDLSVLISPLAKEKRAKNPRVVAAKTPPGKPAAPALAPTVVPPAATAPLPEPPSV